MRSKIVQVAFGLCLFAGPNTVWSESCVIAELTEQHGNQTTTTKGTYSSAFERSRFRRCGAEGTEQWWLSTTDTAIWERLHALFGGPGADGDPKEEIFVEVAGCLSPFGHHGHMGQYRRQLQVNQLIHSSNEVPVDCVSK